MVTNAKVISIFAKDRFNRDGYWYNFTYTDIVRLSDEIVDNNDLEQFFDRASVPLEGLGIRIYHNSYTVMMYSPSDSVVAVLAGIYHVVDAARVLLELVTDGIVVCNSCVGNSDILTYYYRYIHDRDYITAVDYHCGYVLDILRVLIDIAVEVLDRESEREVLR